MKYKDLPIGTIQITTNGFKWIKIAPRKWRCLAAPTDAWKIGDIYHDSPMDSQKPGEQYITLQDYINEAV